MLHILLAEDNAGDVVLVEYALREHHIQYELRVVKDGAEAIGYISRIGIPDGVPCPDLMLLDLNLPKIDGAEVIKEFRKHPACTRTPVIVISSSDMQKDRAQTAAFAIACYFRKPSNLDDFLKLGGIVDDLLRENPPDPA
ncbi:MAG: response regulator [Acidobacteriota bacterium]